MCLFTLVVLYVFVLLNDCGFQKIIHVCLQCIDHPSFFFELRTFIIESLLLFKKSLLFRLQRLQARQSFIALHGKQCTSCRLENHKLGFMLRLEALLVFRLLEGVIYGLEALVV